MGRRLELAIAAAAALALLLIVNALIVDGKTKGAEVTLPGGRILDLPSGELQVAEHGPRNEDPILLIHCYSCASDWWDGMIPLLEREHRVVTVDLLGHGGSEKPESGYTPDNQAQVVAEALEELEVSDATVVGHSLGGSVGVALTEGHPQLVARLVIVDMPADNSHGDLGFIASLGFQPVLGEFLWTIKPDFSVRDGLEVAFAPGYDVPDAFVEDVKRLTYTAYDDSPGGNEDFLDEQPLDQRMKATGKPLMVLMGAEEQIVEDPQRALDQYEDGVPNAEVHLVPGAGHSPNVEQPALTAKLILRFASEPQERLGSKSKRASGERSATDRQ
ncbi:MAG TPA: alpha/beta hydrolase [Solirubrobacterales bacterium]|nr:alpha/beta hydrolase [Solirubrobacterales bacterium]